MQKNKDKFDWIELQKKLAKSFLKEFSEKSLHAGPIVFIFMGPMIFGVLAFISLPALYAPTESLFNSVALVLVQAMILSFPIMFLRESIYPKKLWLWRSGLPISFREKIKADIIMLLTILAPVYFICLISLVVWILKWPLWLRLVWPYSLMCLIAAILFSLLLSICYLWVGGNYSKARSGKASNYDWRRSEISLLKEFQNIYTFKELILKSMIRNNFGKWLILNLLFACIMFFMTHDINQGKNIILVDSTFYAVYLILRDGLIKRTLAVTLDRIKSLPINSERLLMLSRVYSLMPVLIISVTMVTIKLIEDEFSAKLLFLVLYLILGALLIICKTMSGTRERVALVFIYWAGLIVLGY